MKNKILIVSVLIFVFVIATGVYAEGQNSKMGNDDQVLQQVQVTNKVEDSQTKTQEKEQVQQQTQEKLREENKIEDQAEVQNQDENKDEEKQLQTGSAMAEQRRSQVANAVQEMLQVAERNGGIGEQIKTIAQNQNQNQEKIEMSLQKVQKRSGFAKFFIGADYGEIKNAKKLLEQNQEQAQQLDQIKNQLLNQSDQQQLTEQIKALEQNNLQIEDSLETSQKGFSLFGWMFRLFSK